MLKTLELTARRMMWCEIVSKTETQSDRAQQANIANLPRKVEYYKELGSRGNVGDTADSCSGADLESIQKDREKI